MHTGVSEIPKAEMHLHLEGAIQRDTYVELRRRDEPSFTLDERVPWFDDTYRFEDLGHFLDTASPCVTKRPEDYGRIATELFEDLVAQNVIYTEVTVASTRIPIGEIAHAIDGAFLSPEKKDGLRRTRERLRGPECSDTPLPDQDEDSDFRLRRDSLFDRRL